MRKTVSIYSLMVIMLITLVNCGQMEKPTSQSDVLSSNMQALTNHTGLTIPDLNEDNNGNRLNEWVKSEITLSDSGYGQHPRRAEVSIQHPYCGDLSIMLESPSGKTEYLRQRTQSNKNEKQSCLFIDKDISTSFIGDNDGTWKLWLIDLGKGDWGALQSWSLIVNECYGVGCNDRWGNTGNDTDNTDTDNTVSAPSSCNGICSYGAICGDFCPSTATCTWVSVGNNYYPQITACQSTSDYYNDNGYGNGSGSGYGNDNGYGSGSGYGNDNGYGSGSGYGNDNGYGNGSGNSNCYPWGCY